MGEQTKNMLIGVFVIAACGVIIWLIMFLKPTVGDGKQTLYVRFSNVNQINVGTRVLFAGKPVGEVVAIDQIYGARKKPIADVLGEIYYYQLVLKVDSSVRVYDTDEITITSNWSEANFKSGYEPVKKFHGAAYYVVKGNSGNPEFIKNPNYKNVPDLKFLRPKELPHFGLINSQPAYITGQTSPDMLQFLISPELYLEELTIEKCYTDKSSPTLPKGREFPSFRRGYRSFDSESLPFRV